MIAVPSILIVAPSGIVNEEIRFDIPIFFSSVSIDMGIVAFEVAVENAKAITGKKFFINLFNRNKENANANEQIISEVKVDDKKLAFMENIKNTYKYQEGLNDRSWNALFVENHDLGRCINKFGSLKDGANPGHKKLF